MTASPLRISPAEASSLAASLQEMLAPAMSSPVGRLIRALASGSGVEVTSAPLMLKHAAPELYEALHGLSEATGKLIVRADGKFRSERQAALDAMLVAETALAKARGE